MARSIALALVTAFVLFALTAAGTAQETKHKEAKKAGMHTELRSVSCDPTCGFKVRSHDEKELISIIKTHAKKAHGKDVTDEEVKQMMKTETM